MINNLIDLGGNAISMYFVIERFSEKGRCYLTNEELGEILKFGRLKVLQTRRVLIDNCFIKTVYKQKRKKGYIKIIEQRTKISDLLEG